jgi:hypothetical protein
MIELKNIDLKLVRVGICNCTGKEVVQEKINDEWLCLHNETQEEDQDDVNALHEYIKDQDADI